MKTKNKLAVPVSKTGTGVTAYLRMGQSVDAGGHHIVCCGTPATPRVAQIKLKGSKKTHEVEIDPGMRRTIIRKCMCITVTGHWELDVTHETPQTYILAEVTIQPADNDDVEGATGLFQWRPDILWRTKNNRMELL